MKEKVINALVVDDNEVNTIVLSNMLELFDINIDQADSGMKALEMMNAKNYDIIFLDHVMPNLDGVQTTKAIRERSVPYKQIIIALTSNITEEISKQYQLAGANDTYSKPLGLVELTAILREWCPQLSVRELSAPDRTLQHKDHASLIRMLIHEISEINYEVGLRYAVGDPMNYINILKVSLKDIRSCFHMVQSGYENRQLSDMLIGVHNLKSVFANIGALELAETAKKLEQAVLQKDVLDFYENHCSKRIADFYKRLEAAIEAYDRISRELSQEELPDLPMTREEYEQSLTKVIYYIKRFDYAAILGELELLMKRGRPDCKTVMEHALAEIKDFQYESALLLLVDMKKEMEHNTISSEADY